MQECDSLPLGAQPRSVVYQSDSGGAASRQGSVDIVHSNTNVMYASAALRQVLPDGGIGRCRFEKLDQRFATLHGCDVRTVRIGQWNLRHPQYVAKKRENSLDRLNCDADVSDARGIAGIGGA